MRRMLLGRCTSPLGALRGEPLGFFTIYDGDIEKYIQDFADKTSLAFDTLFPHVVGAPPTPVAKNAQAFYQWGVDEQPSADRVLQRLSRASRCSTFEPCSPIATHNRPPNREVDRRLP